MQPTPNCSLWGVHPLQPRVADLVHGTPYASRPTSSGTGRCASRTRDSANPRRQCWVFGLLRESHRQPGQGKKTGSFHYPGGGANYSGKSVYRSLVESFDHPDSNETEWKENIDIVLNWFTEEDFDFVTLYYGEPDKVGHSPGPETEERKAIVRQIDRTIGYLVASIERHNLKDKLNVIITSDHGMTTIKKSPEVEEILLWKYINFKDLVKFDIVDYGGLGMLLPKPGKEEALYQTLKKAHPHLKVYKKEEFPVEFHYAKHERILPILVYGDLGYSVNGRFIIYVNKGDHGFDNTDMDMKTIFRAFGPAFKKNYVSEPFDSIHIYPLMCKLLGVNSEPHNGSLAITQPMLLDSIETAHPTDPPGTGSAALVAAVVGASVLGVLILILIIYVPFTVAQRKKRSKQEQQEQKGTATSTF